MTNFPQSVKQIFDVLHMISEVSMFHAFPVSVWRATAPQRAPFPHFFLSAFHRLSTYLQCFASRTARAPWGAPDPQVPIQFQIAKEPERRQWIAPHLIKYE